MLETQLFKYKLLTKVYLRTVCVCVCVCRVLVLNCRHLKPVSLLRRSRSGDQLTHRDKEAATFFRQGPPPIILANVSAHALAACSITADPPPPLPQLQ